MLLEIATSQATNSLIRLRAARVSKPNLLLPGDQNSPRSLTNVVPNSFAKIVASSMVAATTCAPALAKQVQEAVNDMSNLGETDPNGVKWMVVCISLIFFLAISIMGTTVWYMYKGKKKAEK